MSDIDDDDDDSNSAEPARRVSPVDFAQIVREAADEAIRLDRLARATDDALKPKSWFATVKGVVSLLLAIGTAIGIAAGGLITLGERISIVSDRAERAEKSGAHLAGRLDVVEPRVSAIEWQIATANKERGSLAAQIAENAGTIARQIEDLRKTREDTSVRLGRIEQRLDDVKAAIERMETRGKWGGLSGQ